MFKLKLGPVTLAKKKKKQVAPPIKSALPQAGIITGKPTFARARVIAQGHMRMHTPYYTLL